MKHGGEIQHGAPQGTTSGPHQFRPLTSSGCVCVCLFVDEWSKHLAVSQNTDGRSVGEEFPSVAKFSVPGENMSPGPFFSVVKEEKWASFSLCEEIKPKSVRK